MSGEALDEIQWKSPEFIQERGLHTGNVLEYFSLSPFYDRTSNNQQLMMQFQYQQIQIPPNTTFQQFFQAKLQEMTGVVFVIAYNREPDFWIIRKQLQLDSKNALTLQDYYIIGANVYQAPKVYDVLSSRLLSSVLQIRNSIDLLNNMTQFHISDGGHSYNNAIHQSPSNINANNSSMSTTAPGKSTSITVQNTGTTATPIAMQTPQTVGPNGGPTTNLGTINMGSSTNNNNSNNNNSHIEITSGAFDSLLNNVIQSSVVASTKNGGSNNSENSEPESKNMYLDGIPLYGRGSTVEMLGLKVNLGDDNN
ncbi:mediator of RNA polymerase II transcription subunit 6 [Scheffersomyces xylosifermentans]|uniref:mediator of RNA polymerase II transcription subunit 6 n=1 Tax=Scheffersomyces xylosifermentans TaxID=1304137 RepID=UPI00315C776D